MEKLRNIFAAISGVFAISGPIISGCMLAKELSGQMSNEPWGMCNIYVSNAPANLFYCFAAVAVVCAIVAIVCHLIYKKTENENQDD